MVASSMLATTTLSAADIGVKYAQGSAVVPKHDAAYWDEVTRGFDFSDADRAPPDLYNKVLWAGMTDGKPYPALRHGRNTGTADPD